jgi:hypothetical protein
MNTETMLTIFVIVAAIGLVAVVAVEVISMAQEAEARGLEDVPSVLLELMQVNYVASRHN